MRPAGRPAYLLPAGTHLERPYLTNTALYFNDLIKDALNIVACFGSLVGALEDSLEFAEMTVWRAELELHRNGHTGGS